MSILRKIMTAVRGGAREVGELVVDANGTRIFEQEIQDAKTHLNKAKHDLRCDGQTDAGWSQGGKPEEGGRGA